MRGPMAHLGIIVYDGKFNSNIYPEFVSRGDVVLLQRDFPRDLHAYEQIKSIAHQSQKPIIFDIDDLLLLMPEDHPERESHHYIESLLPMLQTLHEADLVTTTTARLKSELLKFNQNVTIIPNFFDDRLWQFRDPETTTDDGERLVIGYMGSESHMPDLVLIESVLLSLLNKYPNQLAFRFWGIKPPLKIANYPQVKWIPAYSYEYVDFAAHFQTQHADLFIAPLVDNRFNQAKSPLKFFEYSALGVPGVYSKLDPFEQAITHGHDGFLASSEKEWFEYLELLIQNRNLRYQMAKKAQKTIQDHWLLSKNAYKWQEAYAEIANKRARIKNNFADQHLDLIKSINKQYHMLHTSLKTDIKFRDDRIEEKNNIIQEKDSVIREKDNLILALTAELTCMKNSRAWRLVLKIRALRDLFIPPGSFQAKIINNFLQWRQEQKSKRIKEKRKEQLESLLSSSIGLTNCEKVEKHQDDIDIIICVHNALDDVRKCLDSVQENTDQPFNLIIVDDGSDQSTRDYLHRFVNSHSRCQLIRNEQAMGYTKAANAGMRASKSSYLVLLNSDTIVTPNWIDRLYRGIIQDDKIGVVGPLSNTASWQSIPELSDNGDWAINQLPKGVTTDEMGRFIAKYAGCIHPTVPLLNGFCLMMRKEVIEDIGLFDEDNFGHGYGEEDDFIIRANNAGWLTSVIDDAFIYHAQSKSYTNESRFALQTKSGENLKKKHGPEQVMEKVALMNPNRVMEGIRARSKVMTEREDFLIKGKAAFESKRILFVLPVMDAGGGANVIFDEAKYMLEMGVNVGIFNLSENKARFLDNYAHVEIPFVFGKPQDLPKVTKSYDAVIASANYSVPWLVPLQETEENLILGYYVQGFEPLMYEEKSDAYKQALASYMLIKDMKRFTKTQWTRNKVVDKTGASSEVVGISVNIDLFRPRDMIPLGLKPVTIVAMIRPGSPYRSPEMTISILRHVSKKYGRDVDIWLFGSDDVRDVVDNKLLDFNWQQLGKLTQIEVASMMSKVDIFTDFSSHQAMGLTALEAMGAGCAVIVPKNGGAVEFVNHRINGLIAETSHYQASVSALEELIEDDQLREKIQLTAIHDVVHYYPERVSYNILSTLFGD